MDECNLNRALQLGTDSFDGLSFGYKGERFFFFFLQLLSSDISVLWRPPFESKSLKDLFLGSNASDTRAFVVVSVIDA